MGGRTWPREKKAEPRTDSQRHTAHPGNRLSRRVASSRCCSRCVGASLRIYTWKARGSRAGWRDKLNMDIVSAGPLGALHCGGPLRDVSDALEWSLLACGHDCMPLLPAPRSVMST